MIDLHEQLRRKIYITIVVIIVLLPLIGLVIDYVTRSSSAKSNIRINTKKVTGPLYFNWKAIAQGGEEQGVQMLQPILSQLAELKPRYIRIDHIYDFYDVIERNGSTLSFNWARLDKTVCDIYTTGAKPFFVLGYMSPALSKDGTLVSIPVSWDDWAEAVQKTIERYSGQDPIRCPGVGLTNSNDIYYEVWNEPDLDTFGKWSLYGGVKDYRTLYYYSSLGARRARDVNRFHIGGPATTAVYKNWLQTFLDYVIEKDLRIDFLSWHHYTKDPQEFTSDVESARAWLPQDKYARYYNLPKLITEWGYDSVNNDEYNSQIAAAYTVASVRNLVDQKIELAFVYEAKDGPQTNLGILTATGVKKPRYDALLMLNKLEGYRLDLQGEGSFVKGIASKSGRKIAVVLTNYDKNGANTELVPVTFSGLAAGNYRFKVTTLGGTELTLRLSTKGEDLTRNILMKPNLVSTVELISE